MKFRSIRHKLIFSFSMFIAILLLGIASLTYAFFSHSTRELIFSQQFSMLAVMAKSIDGKIDTAKSTLSAVARIVPVEMLDDDEAIKKWLDERKGMQSVFNHGLFLLHEQGTRSLFSSNVQHPAGSSNHLELVYNQAIKHGGRYVSLPIPCSATQHPTIIITAPILDQRGAIAGLMCGTIDPMQKDGFFHELSQIRLGSSGYMYMFATDRTIVVHKDDSRIGKKDVQPGSNKIFDRAITGFEGSDENINSRGGHFLTSVKRLESTDWILAANYPYDEAMLPITQFRNGFALSTLLVLFAGIILARRLGTSITRPLSELTIQIREMSRPDTNRTQCLQSKDRGEIGTLTDSFNGLLHELRIREEELYLQADILEEEIVERQKAEELLRLQTTMLQESNQRFKVLHEASFGGICIHDNGIILDCNQGMSEMTGFANEKLIGMNILELIAEEYREQVLFNIRNGLELSYELEGLRKDGIKYYLKLRCKNFPYQGRQIRVVDFRDITERKQAEDDRLLLEQQFHHAQKLESLGVLAGGIAHDFNNIMTVILLQCFMARKNSAAEPTHQTHIAKIEIAGHRAANLCRQMLIYAGKSKPEQTRINMSRLVDEIVTMMQAGIRKNVSIRLDLKHDSPDLTGDSAQIQQIVMNLIINAAEAIGDDHGTIDVSLLTSVITTEDNYTDLRGEVMTAGEYCCLTVSDTGCGMDAATKQRIFEPFFTTKFTGRGLGMSAVLGIIKSHNGALQLTSKPGIGTTFKVFFPLEEMPSAEQSMSQNTVSKNVANFT